jgi:glucan 1,3-beta-glucosidase
VPIAGFMSVRDAGAKGDGVADDTVAIQNVINSASKQGKIVYFDAGTYKVTKTILIPAGIKITGEAYPVIMSSGPFFNDINKPQPVLQVGKKGQEGAGIEWSNMIVSTQGGQAGAILIQFNLATKGVPSAIWDVHTRIGGFAGSQLQLADCPTTPTVMTPPAAVNPNCIAAYMSMHITKSASNLYMENNWLWTADHDIDSSNNIQITVYTGRGLLIESEDGTIWL